MIDHIDHLVLTVHDLTATVDFYTRGLGMARRESAGRLAVVFGRCMINLHVRDAEPILPRADVPTAGSGDLCLIAARPLADVIDHLQRERIAIEIGPVTRLGAAGPIRSIYLRDPDRNLVEIAEYVGRSDR